MVLIAAAYLRNGLMTRGARNGRPGPPLAVHHVQDTLSHHPRASITTWVGSRGTPHARSSRALLWCEVIAVHRFFEYDSRRKSLSMLKFHLVRRPAVYGASRLF